MSDTQPNKLSDTQPRNVKPGFRLPVFWISALILLGALLFGVTAGYAEGLRERLAAEKAQQSQMLNEQIVFAQQDFDAGRYDVARQRLEEILKRDPGYPGAADLFAKIIVQMAITPTPMPTLTPTITPTPDLRSQDAIFAQVQQQMQNREWTNAMASLDSLRKAGPTYKAAQVDAMYYGALRNRGVDQIIGMGEYAETTNLEGGIYDLTLAERFGPLDGSADGIRTFARLYVIGASFWELDWAQAVSYFGQVNQFAPNLRDASNNTAAQRYYDALLRYGDQQAEAKKLDDRCAALNSWGEASNISPLNDEYAFKYNKLNLECNPPTATIDPATLFTATPEVVVLPTETPTLTVEPTP